jgi:hypothetical protein
MSGGGIVSAGDEYLANRRFDVTRCLPQDAVVDGHVAPSQKDLTLLGNDLLELFDTELALGRVGRQEDRADAVVARRRQLDA